MLDAQRTLRRMLALSVISDEDRCLVSICQRVLIICAIELCSRQSPQDAEVGS